MSLPPVCLGWGTARERKAQPAAGPVDQRARSRLCAAAARAGKKTTLFPLRPPPRIMYQDYPGNFDTSSRGSSGSPAHAESYSSGGGGQQVRAGRGAPGGAGRLLPSSRSLCLHLQPSSFPFPGQARKILRGHRCKLWIFFSVPPHPPLHFFFLKQAESGLEEPTTPSFPFLT